MFNIHIIRILTILIAFDYYRRFIGHCIDVSIYSLNNVLKISEQKAM